MSDKEQLDLSNLTEAEKKEVLAAQERADKLQKSTSGHRDFKELGALVILVIAGLYSVYQIYNVFGGLTALRSRAIHLAFALAICLIKFSANKNKGLTEPWLPYFGAAIGIWTAVAIPLVKLGLITALFSPVGILIFLVIASAFFVSRVFTQKWRIKRGDEFETTVMWYDYIFLAFSLIGCSYIAIFADDILSRAGIVYAWDTIIGFFLILAVFEATRRSIGYILMYIGVFMLLYCRFGGILPWGSMFWHPGFNLNMIIRHFILTDAGLWSSPLGVCASYISAFLLLGASLHASGLAEVMLRVAKGIFGSMVGGPAKMTVIASTMFSLISGSSTSNVATTGPVTIPLMKKTGIPGYFAAGIEASSSMGGQITPPIMGAVAFIMAEFLGVPYLKVALAATLPALLYYTSVYSMIHFESYRIGAFGLPKDQIPPWKRFMFSRCYLGSPLIVLVAMLTLGWTPSMAAFCAFILCLALSMLRKQTRLNPKRFWKVLSNAGQTLTVVAIPSAVAGFVVGTATLTGLTNNMTKLLEAIAKDNLIITLLITNLMCLAIGMGVPTVANYILMSIITIPIMIRAGVEPMAAHLFCFHFGIMSEITPPVAITSYTAAAIGGANFWRTTFSATRLAAVAYIVPYFFVYNTTLLLGQHPFHPKLIIVVITAVFGTVVFASFMAGYQKRKLYLWERLVVGVSGAFLIKPETKYTLAGLALFIIMLAWQYIWKKEPKSYKKPERKDYSDGAGLGGL